MSKRKRSCQLQFVNVVKIILKTKMNTDPTSEVGLPKDSECEKTMWQTLFEMQNNNFNELIKAFQAKSSESEHNNFSLPQFDPELENADAVAWCSTANLILAEKPLSGSSLIIALSKCLKGSAAQWLTSICYPGIKWSEFKTLFEQRYGNIQTPAGTLWNVLNSRPKSEECLSVYASRLVSSLTTCLKDMTIEEVSVSVVLAHVARFDDKLAQNIFKTKVTTRQELQQELNAFSYQKPSSRHLAVEHSVHDTKRIKLSTNVKCYFCGKTGHKIADCRSRNKNEKSYVKNTQTANTASFTKDKSSVTCYRCGNTGHIAPHCTKKINSLESKQIQIEKRIDVCAIEPMGALIQSGESYPYYFDSGAECSLIKEAVAVKFPGRRSNNCVILSGIGNAKICSSLQILSSVVINDHVLEVLFHVVPNESLKYNIIIGREILYLGFGVTVTLSEFSLFRDNTLSIDVCSVSKNQFALESVDTDLFDNEKAQLISILRKYSDWFIDGIPGSRVTTGQLEIRLQDPNKTVQRRPYRLSPDERDIVRNKIEELIKSKIVQPSSSPFASPILLVKKKDGTDRLCVDYRELNSNTIADKFPLPLISDQIARLRGAKYFTCLDMASGFHQIPIHPQSIELTAFVTPDGQFEYLSMPFGLKNAPSVFQRAISKALGDLIYSFVIVYMDDILIVSSNKDEALSRLEVVLNVLTKAGFSLNIKKCAFMKTRVEYLGFVVEAGELRPNPRKIKALANLPSPQSVSQLRQFIGLATYFRQFVHKFSQIMKPLYFLVNAKNFVWKPQHEVIRNKIVSILTNEPVLIIFDPQYPIELHTDASAEGYGAILLHRINNKPHVVEYYSKRTTNTESRYHSYELETLALVNAVKHFRHYLHGRRFIVFTDCNSLKATRYKIELTPRVHRWWAYLQSFHFDIQYRDGKRMAHVDFLSRNHISENNHVCLEHNEKRIDLAEITNDWLLAEQQKDIETSTTIGKLLNNEIPIDISKTFELRKGILYRKIQRNGKTHCLPVVPKSFRWSVINSVHESIMHLGWEKTLDKVYDYFWFENMSKYVRKFVENCITCKLSKTASGKISAELHCIPKVSIPWHTLHMDITGKLSGKSDIKEYVIVLIDAFTKYVLLYHSTNIDSENCVRALRTSISLFGVPTRVIADQGRSFTGKQFNEFCSSQNIKLHLIATGASRANGQVERVMSTLKNLLTAVETSRRSWQDALSDIQLAMNCTVNRITKASPLELLIGKKARPLGLLSIDDEENEVDIVNVRMQAEENIKCNAAYDKARFDKNKSKVIRFSAGDYVLIKAEERHQTKLDPKYRGPFVIVEVLDNDRYVLKSLTGNRKYKYAHEHLRRLPDLSNHTEFEQEIADNENMEVDKVVEKDGKGEVVEKDGKGEVVEKDGKGEVVEKDGTKEVVEKDGNNICVT